MLHVGDMSLSCNLKSEENKDQLTVKSRETGVHHVRLKGAASLTIYRQARGAIKGAVG